jgi:hypothetical protein
MRGMRWALICGVLIASWALPAGALAGVLAPPGHAGANQYFETIPTAAGNAAPPGSVRGSGSPTPGSQALAGHADGQSTDVKLAHEGKSGQAAASLAAATASPLSSRSQRRAAASAGGGGSVAGGIERALTGADTGGLGVALPLLLATFLLVAVAIVLARARPRSH